MLKVGVTGGIGSGKSTVCQVFKTLGIPVLDADSSARHLIETDEALIAGIKQLFGEDIYVSGKLDSKKVSDTVFQQPEKLAELNALVHPATIEYSKRWLQEQNAPYAIKEAAIFFESGSAKDMDVMIGVSAPDEIRIKRAMQRNQLSREQILERIARQMDQAEKMSKCDYVINNDGNNAIIPQVMDIHQKLLAK